VRALFSLHNDDVRVSFVHYVARFFAIQHPAEKLFSRSGESPLPEMQAGIFVIRFASTWCSVYMVEKHGILPAISEQFGRASVDYVSFSTCKRQSKRPAWNFSVELTQNRTIPRTRFLRPLF